MSISDLEDATRLPPIASRYELIEPIARGGVAWVWRAHDLTLDRPVAIKILRADANPALAARFAREAQTAARIKHPSVVSVYDAGVHDGLPFLAMELLEGETLRTRLVQRGRLTPSEVRAIGRALAGALDAVARAGLVHGDVKPENVIIRGDVDVSLTDLGLARAVWESGPDDETSVYGTPGYLAPERRHGHSGDQRSDIYALGALLFECATGTPPPHEGTVPWATGLVPDVPDEISAVIARATLPDPAERYPTAAAMALQLAAEPSATGSATQAVPVAEQETVAMQPAIERRSAAVRKQRKRRRNTLMSAGLVVVLLLTYLVFKPADLVEVPRLTGIPQAQAEAELKNIGLVPGIAVAYDSERPAGTVISQDPRAGQGLEVGATATLTVSLGARIVKVPGVRGVRFADAREELEHAGFTDIRQREVFSDVKTGLVAGTQPARGELAEGDAPIFVEISKGPEFLDIPSVSGMSRSAAVQLLRDTGFQVTAEGSFQREIPSGTSIGTKPAAGKQAVRGSTITLFFSKGPPLTTVPNFSCMARKDAENAAAKARLEPSFEAGGSRVVDQDPAPGQQIPEGSVVSLLMGRGAFC